LDANRTENRDWLLAEILANGVSRGIERAHWDYALRNLIAWGQDSVPKKVDGKGQMKIGSMRLQPRTVKGLYYAAGSFTVLIVGAAFFFLMGLMLMPEAREVPWR
jgi:hypothetical protein